MFNTIYKSVEIIAPEKRYLSLLQEWYDGLNDGEVKNAICRLSWRELRPKVSYFRLLVSCRHPNPQDMEAFLRAKEQEDTGIMEKAVTKVIEEFSKWIMASRVPQDSLVDERSARISWQVEEMTYFDPETYSAQDKAQYELNREASMFLGMAHLIAQSEEDFVASMVGMNTPFACAGLILSGHVRLIRSFPPNFPDSDQELERFHENLTEHPDDFLKLMLLAHHFGCQQEVVTQVMTMRERFLSDNAKTLPAWLDEYARTEAEDDAFASTKPVLPVAVYELLTKACETLRDDLVAAVEGRERQVGEALNSFLSDLPVPNSPFPFDISDEGEWWKRGEL